MIFGQLPHSAAPSAGQILQRLVAIESEAGPLAGQMQAIVDGAEKAGRGALAGDESARFEGLKRRADALKDERRRLLVSAGGVPIADRAGLRVIENADFDDTRGFASAGHFGAAVAAAGYSRSTGAPTDPRLSKLAAAPGTAGNESVGADGGFLVPPAFAASIFTMSMDEDSLLPMTDEIPVTGNSLVVPRDETTPWGSNGVRASWQGENSVIPPTRAVVGQMDLRLKKLAGLVPVTNELASDAPALAAWLPEKLGASIRWKANHAILFGSGVGTPLGALMGMGSSTGAVVTVTKDAGQVTGTLSATNLANMFARLPPGSAKRAIWLINNDVLPALITLTLGNFPIFVPTGAGESPFAGAPVGTIFGRPVVISQHANTFSQKGDVMLLDLKYYQTITHGAGFTIATSMHLYFDADAMAFRVTFRMDGQPKLINPIDPAAGPNKLSPFVQLGAR